MNLRSFSLALGLLPCCLAAQTPTAIEAVEYDPLGDRWLVSNGSSLLATDGPGGAYTYLGSAQASHGMEVVDGMLVAIGNNVVRAYELNGGTLLGSLVIPGANFLNGMGSMTGGVVVSDFGNGRIHHIDVSDPGAMVATLLATLPGSPNGVVVEPAAGRAVVVSWGSNADIFGVDLETGAVTTLVDGSGLGNLDGIDIDLEGNFYVSSWSPARITRFSNDFSQQETVVSTGLASPADISYALALDTLGVANSGNDVVTWHGFAPETNAIGTAPTPGPTTVRWTGNGLTLEGSMAGTWTFRAYTLDGRCVATTEWSLPAGTVCMDRSHLMLPAAQPTWGWVGWVQAPDGSVHRSLLQ